MNDRNTDAVVHLLRVPFNGLTDCQNVHYSSLVFAAVRLGSRTAASARAHGRSAMR